MVTQGIPTETATMSLDDLVRVVLKLRYYVLGGVLVGIMCAAVASILMTPLYRAEVTTMPATDAREGGGLGRLAGQFGGLAALAGIALPASENRKEAVAVLESKQFALEMINELNLLPVLFESRWDASSGQWHRKGERGTPTSNETWRLWDESIRRVFDDKNRDLIVVRIEWRDRVQAADWANEMISRLNRVLRARRLEEIDRNLVFLNKALEDAQVVELRTAIAQVIQSQVSERMLAEVRQEFALKIVDAALPADLDKPIRPRPLLYVALGASAGMILGFALGLLWVNFRPRLRPYV